MKVLSAISIIALLGLMLNFGPIVGVVAASPYDSVGAVLPPIANSPPPVAPGACFHYTKPTGWQKMSCGSSTAPPNSSPATIGGQCNSCTGVYGEHLSGPLINWGEIYVSFGQYTPTESDSKVGNNAWSIQANSNQFPCSGAACEVQFLYQQDPSSSQYMACIQNWVVGLGYSQSCNYGVSAQTLSSSYTAYVEGWDSGGYLTEVFCSYQQNQCWSTPALADTHGLASYWTDISGTILGFANSSAANFVSPTSVSTSAMLVGLTSSTVNTKVTNEFNSLNYQSVTHYCQRSTCTVFSVAS